MVTETFEKYDAVVLFSSGIDSLACLKWATKKYTKVLALYVNLWVVYSDLEIAAARELAQRFNVSLLEWHLSQLGHFESNIGHIPLRNVFLLELAYLHGKNIIFGMLKGEYSEDKNPSFIHQMQKLFDSQSKRNLYNIGERVTIHTPFSGMTKSDVVKWLLSNGVSAVDLGLTVGCLKGSTCGSCMSCFNRWIALENNGLGDLDVFIYDNHPVHWGVHQLLSKNSIFKDSQKSISFWTKRSWIYDVWMAYDSAYKRNLTGYTPWQLVRELL